MKKIPKVFRALKALVRRPSRVTRILDDDDFWREKTEPICHNGLPVVNIATLFPGLNETIGTFTYLDGSSLSLDIALVKSLCHKFSACRYFEIGTWRGESAASVAEACAECYTLDLSSKDFERMGISPAVARQQGFFSRRKSNVIHLQGNSQSFDFAGLKKKFDVIFIDGDHRYEAVKRDTHNVFEHLVGESSVVVWHDYAYNPEKIRWEVLAGIWDGVPEPFRGRLAHVSNTMCALYSPEIYPTAPLQVPVVPEIKFEVRIRMKGVD